MKAAVIGVGSMGVNHARVYSELSEIDLVAVADVNDAYQKRRLNDAAYGAFNFFRHEFCDWYLEAIKPRLRDPARCGGEVFFGGQAHRQEGPGPAGHGL